MFSHPLCVSETWIDMFALFSGISLTMDQVCFFLLLTPVYFILFLAVNQYCYLTVFSVCFCSSNLVLCSGIFFGKTLKKLTRQLMKTSRKLGSADYCGSKGEYASLYWIF